MERMDETIPGGLYLSSDGKTYHDAHGKIFTEEEVAQMLKVEEPVELVVEKKSKKKEA